MPLVFLHLVVVAISQCTALLILDTVGSTDPLILAILVQFISAVIWILLKYSISIFSLYFWTLDSNSDTLTMDWTTSVRFENPINMHSQTLLVPLIILSHNHQNQNYGLMGPCFLHSTTNKIICKVANKQVITFSRL